MIERRPTDEECLRHYETFRTHVPEEIGKREDYKNNLKIVRNSIVITDNKKNTKTAKKKNRKKKPVFIDLKSLSLTDIKYFKFHVGVYLLFRNKKLVYVGQSSCVERRVIEQQRMREKDFDSYAIIEISDYGDRIGIEKLVIKKYQPEYNKEILAYHPKVKDSNKIMKTLGVLLGDKIG